VRAPVKTAITCSGVVPSAGTTWRIRSSRYRATRCDMLSTSERSEEISRTPVPSSTSRLMMANISSRAPTSTPRVGSSRISTLGLRSIHRPTTTFCWFPPERVATPHSGEGVLMPNPAIARRTMASRRPALGQPQRIHWATQGKARLKPTLCSRKRPSFLRSSLIMTMPAARASRGLRSATGLASISTCPPSTRSMPNRALASSVRPEPTRPARPSTSP